MTLLPIVERELRLASKKPGTYWSRVWFGLLGMIALGWAILTARFAPIAPVGLPFIFKTVRFWGLIYCLFTGARTTADCVSEEKREGTLGLLFLTDLRGYDVVLGKLIARGVSPSYAVMALIPMIWLLSLMGTAGASELVYTVILFGNAMFFSLAAGITVSTFFTDRRRCEIITSATILILFFGVFPLAESAAGWLGSGAGGGAFSTGGPAVIFARLNALANPPVPGTPGFHQALISNAVIHLGAWGLIILSSWRLPYCWRERSTKNARLSLKERWRQWSYGGGQARAARRRIALEANPFFWLATRNRLRPLVPLLFILITVGILLFILIILGILPVFATAISVLRPMFVVLPGALVVFWYLAPKFWISREAARTLSEERRDGTLEMLLSTTLSVREIVKGQWMGLRKCYAAAVLFSILGSALLIFLNSLASEINWLEPVPYATPLLSAGTVMFIADCIALGWVGMWLALRTGNPKKAAQSATAKIIVFPLLLFVFCLSGYAAFFGFRSFPFHISPYFVIGLWLGIGLIFDFLFIWSSRNLLYREFRNVAQAPIESAVSEGAWGRALGRWYGHRKRRARSYFTVNG